MTEAGNTGVAGGTKGASPVPEKTAPDGSTALPPKKKPAKKATKKKTPYPETSTGEQNRDYRIPRGEGVDDDAKAVG